jgi:outer membrane autotransporter protein
MVSRLFQSSILILISLVGLSWSSDSLAQSCGITPVSSMAQIGPAGTTLTYTYELGDSCGTEVGTFAIGSDTTGGATLSALTWNFNNNTQFSVTVTLGPTPGGQGTLVTTCVGGNCGGGGGTTVINATFNTNNVFNFTPLGPTTVVSSQISPFTVGTNLQLNGAPSGLQIGFTNVTTSTSYGNVVPDAGGNASTTQGIFSAGTYLVRAAIACPTLFVLEGCGAVPPVDFTVQVEPAGVAVVGSPAVSTPSGTPASLTVYYGSASIPATDGANMFWSITAQPPGGDGAVTGAPIAGGAGQSNAQFSATVPGNYTVVANSGCTFCAPGQVAFTVTVTALPSTLTPVSPNPATGTVGVAVPFTVRLEQGGVPVNAANIQWSATAPFAPAAFSSATDPAGETTASFTASAPGNFTNAITALYDPDGVPANGDEVTLSFDANIAFVATLAITGGNNQNALISTAFAAPLQVVAQNSGVPAAGVGVDWVVASGSATLSAATSLTDGGGNAGVTVTAGAVPGPVVITATRQDDATATVSFNLTVEALGTLTILSGNGQQLAAGVASAPMEVELRDAAGLPIAGAVVDWSTSIGTLASATSTTDAAGIASNTVTTTAAGAVDVTASSPLAAAPAVFALNGALGSLPGLSATQQAVAIAIDSACPALAALATRTPQQQDLLDRCQELIIAAGIDPGATIGALDELMADVALTQSNAAFNAAQSQFQNLKTRIAALRSGTGGTSFGGLAINTPTGPVSLGTLASAFANATEPAEVGTDFSRWGFFAAGTIGRGEADAGSRNPAYDFDINGVTAGVDYRRNDKWIIGGAFGYTRQDTTLPDGRGDLDTSGWTVSAYSTYYQQDSWYMDGVVTWGQNDYELLREIRYTLPLAGGGTSTISQVAEADSGGDLLSTAFTFGRDFNRGAWGIGPYGRLLYTRLSFDSINEELLPGLAGSGLGLRIDNRDISSLASVLGAKFTYTHSTDWGVLMPHLQLEWEHEFKDDPQSLEARFINDPTGTAMVISGDPLDTDYFRLGLGLSMVLTRGRSGFLYYEQLVGRSGMSQYSLALGFRMEF